MFSKRGRFARTECDHTTKVTVRNSGIERTVCEACGHVSFRDAGELTGTAERSQFEREVERRRAPVG